MLLIACDSRLEASAAQWIPGAILEGVRVRAPSLVVAPTLAHASMASAADKPSVVLAHRVEAGDESLRTAAVSAAAVVWVTAADCESVRNRFGLDSGGGWKVPVALVVVSDRELDTAGIRARAGVQVVRRISGLPTKAGQRRLRRLGRSLDSAAAAPQRVESADHSVRRESAATAAARSLESLLEEPGVEEFQIRGGQSMLVEHTDGSRELRDSPFASDDDLIAAVRFLAGYSGDRPQRFDELDPRLDTRVGQRWRLHAEAFVCSPPMLVLRSNLAGEVELAELGLCDDDLAAVLTEAVAGRVRANVVVAAAMGGGKTTLCQALLKRVPPMERIDTIEDTPELRLVQYGIHPNAFERLTRDANNDGVGKHSMADHVRDAKRANSSKLVVGEIRGEGTMALLDAMSSGLDGCLVTLHSPPGEGVLEKLTAYACSEGADVGHARRSISIAVHLLVWMGRNSAGERVIADVTQIVGLNGAGTIATLPLWQLRPDQRWAQRVESPVGRVADLYCAAGVSL